MAVSIAVSEPHFLKARRFQRYKLDVPVRVLKYTDEKIRIIDGRGNELNEGGMSVNAGVELDLKEMVEVEFTPPYTGVPLRVRATVRNRTGYRYGLEFMMESPEDCEKVVEIRLALQGMGKVMPN
jgi:hypothetical protein